MNSTAVSTISTTSTTLMESSSSMTMSDRKVKIYLPQIYFTPHMPTLAEVETKLRDVLHSLQIGKTVQVNARCPEHANYCFAFAKIHLYNNEHAAEFFNDLNHQPFVYICHNAVETSLYNNLSGYWIATRHQYHQKTNRVRLRYKECKPSYVPSSFSPPLPPSSCLEIDTLCAFPVALPPCNVLPPTNVKTVVAMALMNNGSFTVPVHVLDQAAFSVWPGDVQHAFTAACQQSMTSSFHLPTTPLSFASMPFVPSSMRMVPWSTTSSPTFSVEDISRSSSPACLVDDSTKATAAATDASFLSPSSVWKDLGNSAGDNAIDDGPLRQEMSLLPSDLFLDG